MVILWWKYCFIIPQYIITKSENIRLHNQSSFYLTTKHFDNIDRLMLETDFGKIFMPQLIYDKGFGSEAAVGMTVTLLLVPS